MAALARLQGHAARHEGRGGPPLPPGHQPARSATAGRTRPRASPTPAGVSTRRASFNDKNPWWIVMPDLARYLQRVSFLLRQGRPGERRRPLPAERRRLGALRAGQDRLDDRGAGRSASAPTLSPAVLAAGFNLDFVDDGVLAHRARMRGRATRHRPEPISSDRPAGRRADATRNAPRPRDVCRARACASSRRGGRRPWRLATRRPPADHADDSRRGAERLFRQARRRRARSSERETELAAALTTAAAAGHGVSERRRRHRLRPSAATPRPTSISSPTPSNVRRSVDGDLPRDAASGRAMESDDRAT